MFINNFDPVAFQVFFVDIRWYSLSYIFGLIFGWIYCQKNLIKDNLKKKLFDDYILYVILGIIVGGRLGYILIYNPIYYFQNFKEILMIWNGGMSFHGALVGIIITTIVFCKKNNENIFYFLDLVSLSAPIGIFFGRISNFINSELYGRETDVAWSVKFIQIDNLNRHPSQIYEALFEGIILFIILNFLHNRLIYRPGIIASLFLFFYSIFRFMIEFVREPDAHIGLVYLNMTMGQIISLITIMISLNLIYFLKDVKK